MSAHRIVALAGSARVASYNGALIRAAQALAPASLEITTLEIDRVPFYNADVEAAGDPREVRELKEAISGADAVLIATPEYNGGIPGMLTTAIDWASRFPGRSPLTGKPVAFMGAARGSGGTSRAQLHLRRLLVHVHARVLPPPEVHVAWAHQKFDEDLTLTDDLTKEILRATLERFVEWIELWQEADRWIERAPSGA